MRALFPLIVMCLSCQIWADDDWNQFRGPRGDGCSRERGLPVTFGDGSPEQVWKIAIPGRAWSSPAIWGRQIWVTNAPPLKHTTPEMPKVDPPLELSAVCLDLNDGRMEHNIKLFDVHSPQITHETNSYGSPTPFVEDGRAYVHFGAYGTACLDTTTGEKLWSRTDLPCDHYRGPGSSVAVYGDLVYLSLDGIDVQYLVALNKHTGETVWKRDRDEDVDFGTTNGDAKKAYSTPLLIDVAGRKLLISSFAAATIAYDPATGKTIWVVKHGGVNASARPLFGNGLLYLNSSDGPNPMMAVNPSGSGDITKNILWRTAKASPKRPSQLLIGDLLFMMNDSGVASCLDAKTGQEIWTERLEGEYWSSPIYADGLVYCCSMEGHVPVFKAAREFELVAENKFDEGFVASPAVAGKSLILRSKDHLYRFEVPSETQSAISSTSSVISSRPD